MERNDAQLARPGVLYKNTKANIEALTGVPEGAFAYATDTDLMGTFNGTVWLWGGSAPITTALDDFQLGNGAGVWIKQTVAYVATLLSVYFDLLYIRLADFPNYGSKTPLTINDRMTIIDSVTSATKQVYLYVLQAFLSDGWTLRTETWTRTGNHTFTVPGDLTLIYRKGAKVRYKDGGSNEYGAVGSSTYAGGPNTTTVNLIVNTDFAMAAGTITEKYISYIENPEGFPFTFNYTATFSRGGTAFTNAPTLNAATFKAIGNKIEGFIDFTMPASAGGTGEIYASVPITVVTNRMDVGQEIVSTAKLCTAIAMSSINKLNFYDASPVAVIAVTNGYRYQFNFRYLF